MTEDEKMAVFGAFRREIIGVWDDIDDLWDKSFGVISREDVDKVFEDMMKERRFIKFVDNL